MGPQQEVEDRLLEFGDSIPEVDSIIPDSHRAPLDEKARHYSPFTYAQSSILRQQTYGVCLVFGSQALGLDLAREASQKLIPVNETGVADGQWEELLYASSSGGAMDQSLEKFLMKHDTAQRLIAVRNMIGSKEELAEQVEAALTFCRQHERRRRQWMRVVLLFDSAATWDWLNLTTDVRKRIENRADATLWLTRWDAIGLRQRLDQHGRISSLENCKYLLDKTGGWPWLLEKVSSRWTEGNDDPLEGTDQLWRMLEMPTSTFQMQFGTALGLGINYAVDKTFDCIAANDRAPQDYVMLEMTSKPYGLSEQECSVAIEYLKGLQMIDIVTNPLTLDNEVHAEPVVKGLRLARSRA
jgi:hypothetical protein